MDTFSKEKRSWVMSRIGAKNTTPELVVRRFLHARGFRFRLHRKDLPGCPDIVLPKYRTAILVHGCFWHGHTCKDGRRPRSNQEYWDSKLDRNAKRDAKNARLLRAIGWKRIVVWECQAADERLLERRVIRRMEAR